MNTLSVVSLQFLLVCKDLSLGRETLCRTEVGVTTDLYGLRCCIPIFSQVLLFPSSNSVSRKIQRDLLEECIRRTTFCSVFPNFLGRTKNYSQSRKLCATR